MVIGNYKRAGKLRDKPSNVKKHILKLKKIIVCKVLPTTIHITNSNSKKIKIKKKEQ